MDPEPSEVSIRQIEERSTPEPNTGCWLWTGSVSTTGYGRLSVRTIWRKAHRVSWIVHHGPIAKGLRVCHKCDQPLCVNPAHLFVGTQGDNMRDRDRKGRQMKAQGHYRSMFTVEEIRQIRATDYSVRGTASRLARRFGCKESVISRIRSRCTYNSVS